MLAPDPGPSRGNQGVALDRSTYVAGGLLLLVAAVAWGALLFQGAGMPGTSMGNAGDMGGMPATTGAELLASGAAYVVAWGVMMAAMMLPSAIPMVALYSAISRNRQRTSQRAPSTALFALVYLLVWVAVGVPVYALSVLLAQLTGANAAAAALAPYGIAAILVIAGLYQFSPLKRACLRVCRSPLGFIMGNWRDGYWGTLRLALRHAVACLGCCVALMVVLVTAGAMGLAWVTLIAIVVFAEKILPFGDWTARITGGALVLLGVLLALQPGLVPVIRMTPM